MTHDISPSSAPPTTQPAGYATATTEPTVENPVGAVHKGIRWALCQLLLELGRVDTKSRVACTQLFDDLDGALYLVERQLEHESRQLLPLVEPIAPKEVMEACIRHTALREQAEALRHQAFAIELAGAILPSDVDSLYLAFSSFVARTLAHLHTSEALLVPALLDHAGAPTLRTVSIALQSALGPDEQTLFQRATAPASRPF